MPRPVCRRRTLRALLVLAASTFAVPAPAADILPIRTFTTADGLTHDRVKCFVSDSHGYLWLCTQEGLSRYDGEQFHNYRTADGLPHASVNDVLETREGTYWIAFNRVGLARFHPERRGAARFDVLPLPYPEAHQVNAVLQDRRGTVWAATPGGLLRLDEAGHLEPTPLAGLGARAPVTALAEDVDGALWLATPSGLMRRRPDGRVFRVTIDGLHAPILALAVDRQRRVWLGTELGLVVIAPGTAGADRHVLRTSPTVPEAGPAAVALTGTGLEGADVYAVRCGPDGTVRAAGFGGLVEIVDGHVHVVSRARGVISVGEDGAGNVWFGTATGAHRVTRGGFVAYGRADGLLDTDVQDIEEDESGAVLVATREWMVHRWDGTRFTGLRFNVPAGLQHRSESWYPIPARDHAGEWWVPTPLGLYRFPRPSRFEDLARARPRRYGAADGMAVDGTYMVFEDSRRDVWIAHHPGGAGVVSVWRRATGGFTHISEGLPADVVPTALGEDAHGTPWVGFMAGGLAREEHGRFRFFSMAEGAPPGIVRIFYNDPGGRMWVTSNAGVVGYVDGPAAPHPRFVADEGVIRTMAGGAARAVAEDKYGRMYFSIGRGVIRVDRARDQTTVFTAADGLPHGSIRVALTQRSGTMWFGGTGGLARFVPEPPTDAALPPVAITAVEAAGAALPVSELGVADVPPFTLPPDGGEVDVEFISTHFTPGGAVRYAYRLEGEDDVWHPPIEERRLHFARLAPGRYRLFVRAVTPSGRASLRPATVTFVVLSHVWQRPWFLALAGVALAGASYGGYRLRLAHLLAVERVRTRIATDLHDDLGSSLSRVVILSEVARRQVESPAEARTLLEDIGATARTLIDATADIIWSIDPRRDAVGPLAARVREFADGLFAGGAAVVRVHAEPEIERIPLDPGERRQLYLLLKEALNNAARHAGCGEVTVRLAVNGRTLLAEVRDDGRGFTPAPAAADPLTGGGHGLRSMRERATALGGTLAVESAPGQGTVLRVEVPM